MSNPGTTAPIEKMQARHEALLAEASRRTQDLREKLGLMLTQIRAAATEVRDKEDAHGEPNASRIGLVLTALERYGEILQGTLDLMCDPPKAGEGDGKPPVHYAFEGKPTTCGLEVHDHPEGYLCVSKFGEVTCPTCRTEVESLRGAAKTFDFTRRWVLHGGSPSIEPHYEIVCQRTALVIGCCTGADGRESVLAEEPSVTFNLVTREECRSCKERG